MMIRRFLLFITMTLTLCLNSWADETPTKSKYADGQWHTLSCKPNSTWYFWANPNIPNQVGQTTTAPSNNDLDKYLWKIEGNDEQGYTICNKATGLYITDPYPAPTGDGRDNVVRLTDIGDKYNITNLNCFQLRSNTGFYLAMWSSNNATMRVYTGSDYLGSTMTIGNVYTYVVRTVVVDAEGNGVPQIVPAGGIIQNQKNYINGDSFLSLNTIQAFQQKFVSGYDSQGIEVTQQPDPSQDKVGIITVKYTLHATNVNDCTYETVDAPQKGKNDVTGKDKTIMLLDPANYITNIDSEGKPKYSYVPAGKAWQLVIEVDNKNNESSFNQWGSCLLASSADPTNNTYYNDFQIYQHKDGSMNFKSNKGDGNRFYLAQETKVTGKDYKVTVRYDGGNVYIIRTTVDDKNYDNVWYAAGLQQDIRQMSCALPTGLNIKSLSISIAEISNLFEDADYAIINKNTKEYISAHYTGGTIQNWSGAEHAAQFQIEFTKQDDLAYHGEDGGLHPTFFLKINVWDEEKKCPVILYVSGSQNNPEGNTTITLSSNKDDAIPFLYSENSYHLNPVTQDTEGTYSQLGDAWKFGENDKWDFDFFANYIVSVKKDNKITDNFGGVRYKTTKAHNKETIYLPASVTNGQWSNVSEKGYKASITKDALAIEVSYTKLRDSFYKFKKLATNTTNLYCWSNELDSLIGYPSGLGEEWNNVEKGTPFASGKGDVFHYSITEAENIPVKFNQNTKGDNPDNFYYGTIFSPTALSLPDGVKAYIGNLNGNYISLVEIGSEDRILPANTAAVVMHESKGGDIDFNISTSSITNNETNILRGELLTITNPKDGKHYCLNGASGIGFYKYSGTNIAAFKAYFVMPDDISGNARYSFSFDTDETGISTIMSNEKNDAYSNTTLYNISGQRVNKMTKGGIYIVNGKKIIR